MSTTELEARETAALGLARRGFLIAQVYGLTPDGVCRCPQGPACDPKNKGKHGGTGWMEHATADPDAIRTRFLADDPGYGVVPPVGSGLVIVDEDRPGSLERLGPLPNTLTVWTGLKQDGRRGRHLYGRLPAGISEADIPYRWEGGEVRARANGQVIGPFCRHRSGVVYEPLNGARVEELPETWVRALIASGRAITETQNKSKSPTDPGWIISEGGRHPWLVDRAHWLRGNGLSGDRLRDELRRLNGERCRPPKPEAEVDEIAGWTEAKIGDDEPGVFLSAEQDGGSGGKKPLRFLTARELASETPEAVEWLWPGYLATGAVTELDGAAKRGGKTTLVLAMVAAVLEGSSFLDQPTKRRAS